MPTYTYKCPIHGEFEVEQRITDPKLEECPRAYPWSLRTPHGLVSTVCGAPVERLIAGGTSFALRGSGWAKDGYK